MKRLSKGTDKAARRARQAPGRGGLGRWIVAIAALCALGLGGAWWASERARRSVPAAVEPPLPSLAVREQTVRELIEQSRASVLEQPASDAAWGRYGQVLDAHSFYPEGIIAYQQARALNPREFRWTYYLARLLDITGTDQDRAVALFREAAGLRPDFAPLQVRLGDALTRKGDLTAANDAYSQAIRLLPRLADGHRGRGQTLLRLGQFEAARAALEEAIRLRPNDGPAHAALAQTHARLGNIAKSQECADAARRHTAPVYLPDPYTDEISLAGVSVALRWQLAIDYMSMGNHARALNELREVAKVRTDDPGVFMRLGECCEKTGQSDEAILQYQRAATLTSNNGQAHARLGALLFTAGRHREALPHLRSALPKASDPGAIRVLMATILGMTGQPEEAIVEFEAAAAVRELDARAENNWGCALLDVGKLDEAVVRFRKALTRMGEYPEAYFNLGRVFTRQARHADAAEAFRRATELAPESATYHYSLAEAHVKLGRIEEARRSYAFGLERDPNHPAAAALRELASAAGSP